MKRREPVQHLGAHGCASEAVKLERDISGGAMLPGTRAPPYPGAAEIRDESSWRNIFDKDLQIPKPCSRIDENNRDDANTVTFACRPWLVLSALSLPRWPRAGDDPAAHQPTRRTEVTGIRCSTRCPDDKLRDFNPDRPSQFTSPGTVDAGRFQLETGPRQLHATTGTTPSTFPDRPRPVERRAVRPAHRSDQTAPRLDLLYDGYLNVRTRDHAMRTTSPPSPGSAT